MDDKGIDLDEARRALRDFTNLANDLLRSDMSTFDENLRQLVALQRDRPFLVWLQKNKFSAVDFDAWYKGLKITQNPAGRPRLTFPTNPAEKLFLQTSLLSALADKKIFFTHFLLEFFSVKGLRDGIPTFNQQVGSPYLRDYAQVAEDTIKALLPHPVAQQKEEISMEMDVFISHASADKNLAKALALLLQVGIGLSPEKIRCTSVEGYKLELGANVEERLKIEIRQSRVFIGLLTPASIQSSWVLFELGARWGLGRSDLMLGPLLAKGATASSIPAPISGINALSANSVADMHQFLRDVCAKLARNFPNPAVYHEQLEAVLSESKLGSFLHQYDGRRIKMSGERREQYFVHQGACNHLDPSAAGYCDELGIQMAVATHDEDLHIHASIGSKVDRNGLDDILRARGIPVLRQGPDRIGQV